MARVVATPRVREDGKWVLDVAPPPPPAYTPVTPTSTGIVGQACAWLDGPRGMWEYGWRVARGPWASVDGSGAYGVTVVPDVEWWAHAFTARPVAGERRIPVECVWLVTYGG